MASDDLPVIVYKLLAYIYECMKREVVPSVLQAQALAEANDTMFLAAVDAANDKGLLKGARVAQYISGDAEVVFCNAALTLDGAEYLLENSTMHKAAKVAGTVWAAAMEAAVQSLAGAAGLM